jgi:hypothetical protein
VQGPLSLRHCSTPITTPTRKRTDRTRLRANTNKVSYTSHTYGELSHRTRATTHTHKQALPLSHGGGHEFESRQGHSKTHRFAAQNYRTQRSLSHDPGLLTATEDRVRTCAKQEASGHCQYALASLSTTITFCSGPYQSPPSGYVAGALEQMLYRILNTTFREFTVYEVR